MSNHSVIHNFFCFFTSVFLSGCDYGLTLQAFKDKGTWLHVCKVSHKAWGRNQSFKNKNSEQLLAFQSWTLAQAIGNNPSDFVSLEGRDVWLQRPCAWAHVAQQLVLVKSPLFYLDSASTVCQIY